VEAGAASGISGTEARQPFPRPDFISRWEGLTRFLDDGRIEIDSNVVERSIRPIALSRKNALFAGSDGGAEHWAVIASLIQTCKLNGVEPLGYLADVLTRIVNGHPTATSPSSCPGPTSARVTVRTEASPQGRAGCRRHLKRQGSTLAYLPTNQRHPLTVLQSASCRCVSEVRLGQNERYRQ
jgi:hypothetical protein